MCFEIERGCTWRTYLYVYDSADETDRRPLAFLGIFRLITLHLYFLRESAKEVRIHSIRAVCNRIG
jgi:hypothetical protein